MKKIFFILIIAIIGSCGQSPNKKNNPAKQPNMGPVEEYKSGDQVQDSIDKNYLRDTYGEKKTTVEESPVKIISARPVTREYSSYRDLSLTYKNISSKNISAIKFKWSGIDAFGEPADMQVGLDYGNGSGFTDRKLRAGKTTTSEWSILSRNLKKVTRAWAYEVVFEDGSRWQSSE